MGKSPKIIFNPGDVYRVDEMERMHLPHWPMEMEWPQNSNSCLLLRTTRSRSFKKKLDEVQPHTWSPSTNGGVNLSTMSLSFCKHRNKMPEVALVALLARMYSSIMHSEEANINNNSNRSNNYNILEKNEKNFCWQEENDHC